MDLSIGLRGRFHLFDSIVIRFYTKLSRPMVGANLSPLVADFVLVCYERDFMQSLSGKHQTDVKEAFN